MTIGRIHFGMAMHHVGTYKKGDHQAQGVALAAARRLQGSIPEGKQVPVEYGDSIQLYVADGPHKAVDDHAAKEQKDTVQFVQGVGSKDAVATDGLIEAAKAKLQATRRFLAAHPNNGQLESALKTS